MVESLNVSVSVAVSVVCAREEAGRGGDGSVADAARLFAEYERRGKEHQFMKQTKLKQKAEDAAGAAEQGHAGGVGVVAEGKKDKEARQAEWLVLQKAAAEKRMAAASEWLAGRNEEEASTVSLGFPPPRLQSHQPHQPHQPLRLSAPGTAISEGLDESRP